MVSSSELDLEFLNPTSYFKGVEISDKYAYMVSSAELDLEFWNPASKFLHGRGAPRPRPERLPRTLMSLSTRRST